VWMGRRFTSSRYGDPINQGNLVPCHQIHHIGLYLFKCAGLKVGSCCGGKAYFGFWVKDRTLVLCGPSHWSRSNENRFFEKL
jgi:hypothetical protein